MPAETHARAADAAVAVGVREEVVHRLRDVLVIRVERLTDTVSTEPRN